jgi:hypothetical protein
LTTSLISTVEITILASQPNATSNYSIW